MIFSTKDIKKDFPIFQDPDLVYLDNASTTHKPQAVLDAVNSLYSDANANVHRALYDLGSKATERFESARNKVGQFINSNQTKEIIFTSGATESINLLAHSIGDTLMPGDEILLSGMEHHSNIVPWQLTAKRTGAVIKYIPLTDTGDLDLSNPDQYFNSKTKIVSITHISNVLGKINPIKDLAKLAHNTGAIFIVDGAQGVPHLRVNVQDLECDFYVFSGHKMLGPTGIGVLWGKLNLLDKMEPFMGGGEMIDTVTMESSSWNDVPYKFEAGTPNFAQAVGLGAAIDYLEYIGMSEVRKHESELTHYAFERLTAMDGLKTHGSSSNRAGVISFNIDGIHPQDLAQFLNEDNIAIRVGHHCAQPLLASLGETSTARISFYIYNDESDIDKFCNSIKNIRELF